MFFKRSVLQHVLPPIEAQKEPKSATTVTKKSARQVDNILLQSPLYQFKRDVLSLVAKMNQGVVNTDCEMLKKQTMFVQSQLLHALTHDPSMPGSFKILLMEYHAKSVRATLTDRRGEHSRDEHDK
ncbi:hypothetical protein [Herminiimonas fonticola]|uniref:Uncharacterized protein n=1 Tax=Herminiimonas fonticola TaxID=303380 RepID=A0A4R6G6D3_9BURK|nr:hypothetical protein [Herminiimonas fonticola]RBA24034.1 hypothetical protein Hfont_1846 [Herminiimonas fonticola]TDN90033.1 hypothetical protein EV677_2104 [Herminiimonas fonticola]